MTPKLVKSKSNYLSQPGYNGCKDSCDSGCKFRTALFQPELQYDLGRDMQHNTMFEVLLLMKCEDCIHLWKCSTFENCKAGFANWIGFVGYGWYGWCGYVWMIWIWYAEFANWIKHREGQELHDHPSEEAGGWFITGWKEIKWMLVVIFTSKCTGWIQRWHDLRKFQNQFQSFRSRGGNNQKCLNTNSKGYIRSRNPEPICSCPLLSPSLENSYGQPGFQVVRSFIQIWE